MSLLILYNISDIDQTLLKCHEQLVSFDWFNSQVILDDSFVVSDTQMLFFHAYAWIKTDVFRSLSMTMTQVMNKCPIISFEVMNTAITPPEI